MVQLPMTSDAGMWMQELLSQGTPKQCYMQTAELHAVYSLRSRAIGCQFGSYPSLDVGADI